MRARLGIWHDEVAVFFDRDPGEPILVELDAEARQLVLIQGRGRRAYLDECDGSRGDYVWRVDGFECDREGFARCELMEVHLRPAANGWTADLPPNHRMPWPKARDCGSYRRDDELLRECLLRKESAQTAGEPLPPPPACIQRSLTREARVALFT